MQHPRRNPKPGMIAPMKHLVLLLALTLASCAQPRGTTPGRTPDGGGDAIEGSENRSDASRTRTRT